MTAKEEASRTPVAEPAARSPARQQYDGMWHKFQQRQAFFTACQADKEMQVTKLRERMNSASARVEQAQQGPGKQQQLLQQGAGTLFPQTPETVRSMRTSAMSCGYVPVRA